MFEMLVSPVRSLDDALFTYSHHLGLIQKLPTKVPQVGSSYYRLGIPYHGTRESIAPALIQLAHNVVKEQHRWLATNTAGNLNLGNLPRQNDATLLSLAAKLAGCSPLDLKQDVIAMGSNNCLPSGPFLCTRVCERVREPMANIFDRGRLS